MKHTTRGRDAARLVAACALVGAAGAPVGAATIVGPATYDTQAVLEVSRGGFPYVYAAVTGSGYKSAGAVNAVAAVDPVVWFSGLPSAAEATADDAHLRALARAQGAIFYAEPDPPLVYAEATAQTTRFFSFSSDFAIDNLPVLLGGVLGAHLTYAELPQQAWAEVSYRFEWTDASGATLATLYAYQARVAWVGSAFVTTRSSGGSADAAAWASAFTPTTLPDSSVGSQQAWSVGLLDEIDTPWVALAGQTYGFRWTLHTEALMEGYSVAGQFTADFGQTADIGLGRSEAELAALGITEVLTTPVPEPAAVWMWLAGVAWLMGRRR
jgi:hypothetical protein